MTPSEFHAYLKGFIDANPAAPTEAQWALICAQLESVFIKVTPDRMPLRDLSVSPDAQVRPAGINLPVNLTGSVVSLNPTSFITC